VRPIQRFYDTFAGVYDEAGRGKFQWMPPQVAQELVLPKARAGMKVLDVGIGTGQSVEKLAELGCEICGVDISERMLKLTRSKFSVFELHQGDLDQGLPMLQERLFDIVMAVGVLEFVQDIDKTLRLLSSHLKPQGWLCFTFEEFIPGHELQKDRQSPSGPGAINSPDSTLFLHHRQSVEEIQQIIANSGLKWVEQKRFQAYLKSEKLIPMFYRVVLAQKS
jgi:predicted TPR repeat methyltransferase